MMTLAAPRAPTLEQQWLQGFMDGLVPQHQTPCLPLREFIRQAWPILEPSTPFVDGYHVAAIADHLEAITRGELQNLIINVPPRHGKSSIVAVLWPVWEWIDHPELRAVFASYGLALSIRDSLKRRRLILSGWYQERWGDRFCLTNDQNAKVRYESSATGFHLATSVSGVGTGEGGQRLVCDDPHNAEEIDSDTIREGVLDWWDGTMSTRGNDPKTVARVIVMQRLHEADLVGHLLERMREGGQQYDHLVLPARYEPTAQFCLAAIDHDPRIEPGALLSPERFGPAEMDTLEADLGPEKAAGQLQQRPAPAGGTIFQRAWWAEGRNRYDPAGEVAPVHIVRRALFFDTAMKDAERHDFSACTVLEVLRDYRLRVRSVWRERLQFPDLVADIEAIAREWNADGHLTDVVIEDKGSGTSAYQTLRAGAPAWLADVLWPFQPKGSKVYRARQAALWCSRDCVLLPHPSPLAPWLHDFTDELEKFPASAHDDQVDTFSMGLIYLERFLAEGYAARRPVEAA